MEDEINIMDYLKMVRKHWLLSIIVFMLILGGVMAYTFSMAPVYETRSLVMVSDSDPGSLLFSSYRPRVDINTEVEIMKSSAVFGRVLEKIPYPFEITVTPIRGSKIIEIKAEGADPELVQGAANEMAESYIDYNINIKKQQAGMLDLMISKKISKIKEELDSLKKERDDFLPEEYRTPAQQRQYEDLTTKIATKQKMYDNLLVKNEEINLAFSTVPNIRIIERAARPLRPSKPVIPLNIAVGVILGMMGAVGISYLKESRKK